MIAVGCHDVAPALFWLQIVLSHQAAQLLGVHYDALVAQCCSHPPVTVALELVTDRADPGEEASPSSWYSRVSSWNLPLEAWCKTV